eukprot:9602307-Prorocentrum_lima.AAC.1
MEDEPGCRPCRGRPVAPLPALGGWLLPCPPLPQPLPLQLPAATMAQRFDCRQGGGELHHPALL